MCVRGISKGSPIVGVIRRAHLPFKIAAFDTNLRTTIVLQWQSVLYVLDSDTFCDFFTFIDSSRKMESKTRHISSFSNALH